MADAVSLPFFVPVFATVQGSIASSLALAKNETGYNAILNQCATVACKRRSLHDFSSYEIYVPGLAPECFACLERYALSLRFAAPYAHELIKRMLREGYYVNYTLIDDFYIPGKSWYGERHLSHDGIICGYDDSDMTYSIAAYDSEWKFSLIRAPQESLMRGIESSMEMGEMGELIAVRMRDGRVELDIDMILKKVRGYMDSDLQKYPPEVNKKAQGAVIYDYLMKYMDALSDGSVSHDRMDWRALRPVWEHKRCMLDRIRAVESKLSMNDSISKDYEPLIALSDELRMMYAFYHRKPRVSALGRIRVGLSELKERELAILEKFVKETEERLKNDIVE